MLTARRLVVAITFISIFAMAVRVSVDTDTWWHLGAGRWIVEHRAIPQADPFSHTRLGAPWRYPGWLVEVPMYWLWTAASYAGLNLFTAVFVAIAFVFVYLAMEGDEYLQCFTLILAAAASGVYWAARPHIVSFALAAVFLYVVRCAARPASRTTFRASRLWLLPPLMAVWANIHGGFAVGFIVMGLALLGETASALWERLRRGVWERERWHLPAWLAMTGLACAAAVALNPAGPSMLLYPFQTVSIGVLQNFIQEWQSPNFHTAETQPFLWLLFATFAVVGLSARRVGFTDLLMVTGFGYLAFTAGRNMALFSLVAPPVLVRHGQFVVDEIRRLRRAPPAAAMIPSQAAGWLNWALLGLVGLAALAKVSVPLKRETNQAALERQLPVGAVAFIRQISPAGPMFNSYNWGGYLLWTLYPEYPVFVDGRTDLYDDAFLREYLDAAAGGPGWQETLDRFDVKLVVMEAGSGLDRELGHNDAWLESYRDDLAVIFEREAAP